MSHSSFTESPQDILWNAVLTLVQSIPMGAPQAALVLRYGEWIMAVKLFRLVEECRMYGQEPTPRDLSFHKIAVTALISTGEFLRWQMVRIPCEQHQDYRLRPQRSMCEPSTTPMPNGIYQSQKNEKTI